VPVEGGVESIANSMGSRYLPVRDLNRDGVSSQPSRVSSQPHARAGTDALSNVKFPPPQLVCCPLFPQAASVFHCKIRVLGVFIPIF